jgi:hypothetical protein
MAKLNAKELKRAHSELQSGARQRVAERGLLQFRADPETVKAILMAAEQRNMAVGALIRQWVQDRLISERLTESAPDLVQRVSLLEVAITEINQKLTSKGASKIAGLPGKAQARAKK